MFHSPTELQELSKKVKKKNGRKVILLTKWLKDDDLPILEKLLLYFKGDDDRTAVITWKLDEIFGFKLFALAVDKVSGSAKK